jgi:hypothetical protein
MFWQARGSPPGLAEHLQMTVPRDSSNPDPATPPRSAPADQRDAGRTPLAAPRAAKLLCERGEYLCLLRDISATGVRLGLFHAVPAATHAFLELANGEVYPMLRVWQRERQASYRFTQPIDPADFIAEPVSHPRRPIRIRVRSPGLVYADRVVRPMELRDISQNGASFEADTYLSLGQTLVLSLEALPELNGWVRWRRGRNFGVVFDHGLRLDELAAHALALQPIAPSADGPETILRRA